MPELTIGSADFEALAADILEAGSALRFRARGMSMDPTIADGDIVEVVPARPAGVRAGDVVLARGSSGRLIVHRVIGRTSEEGAWSITTQGDALPVPDEPILLGQVLGRASSVEGASGRLQMDRGIGRWLGVLWVRCRPAASRASRLFRKLRRMGPAGHHDVGRAPVGANAAPSEKA